MGLDFLKLSVLFFHKRKLHNNPSLKHEKTEIPVVDE